VRRRRERFSSSSRSRALLAAAISAELGFGGQRCRGRSGMNHVTHSVFTAGSPARKRRRPVQAGLGIAVHGLPLVGHAQFEEIVVTAERRETSLQQTPISVVAFSADTIEAKGIETIEDIA